MRNSTKNVELFFGIYTDKIKSVKIYLHYIHNVKVIKERWFTMKTHEDQLELLVARVEKRLSALETNVSHMKSKLAELSEMQEDLTGMVYERYHQAV